MTSVFTPERATEELTRPVGKPHRFLRNVRQMLSMVGFDPVRGFRSLIQLPKYVADLRVFRRLSTAGQSDFPSFRLLPCLNETGEGAGAARGHYFHQDLLVARRVFQMKPQRHIDVGSRIDGFVAHVASFREIDVVDIRPMPSQIPNVRFVVCDVTREVPSALRGAADSVSCLHAIEHFGLGRYGDPLDPDGHRKGLITLTEMLRPGGTLYLSTPIGPQRIEFNGGRVFSLRYLLDLVRDAYRLESFSFVDDDGDLHENVPLSDELVRTSCGVWHGCAILELMKSERQVRGREET